MLYDKQYNELTDAEKTLWATALDVLQAGDTLYGETTDHITWALSFGIHNMNKLYETHDSAMMIIELRRDEGGYGIAFVPLQPNK